MHSFHQNRVAPLPALRARPSLAIHATHIVAVMVFGLVGLLLAAGHFPLLILLAATAFLAGCRRRISGKRSGGHGERKRSEERSGGTECVSACRSCWSADH